MPTVDELRVALANTYDLLRKAEAERDQWKEKATTSKAKIVTLTERLTEIVEELQ